MERTFKYLNKNPLSNRWGTIHIILSDRENNNQCYICIFHMHIDYVQENNYLTSPGGYNGKNQR